jgi:8-oxo-dGTP pyrophosphatase MutT (NUDIX family)
MSLTIDDSWYTRPDTPLPERTSAGGAVVRIERGNVFVALVHEKGCTGYVLPKGGIEPNETLETGALREIEEEAGLTELTLLGELGVRERLSEKKDTWSINHYFLYYTEQLSGTILDTEHHDEMIWAPLDHLPAMFWPDEKSLLERYRKSIYDRVIEHQNPKKRKKGFV